MTVTVFGKIYLLMFLAIISSCGKPISGDSSLKAEPRDSKDGLESREKPLTRFQNQIEQHSQELDSFQNLDEFMKIYKDKSYEGPLLHVFQKLGTHKEVDLANPQILLELFKHPAVSFRWKSIRALTQMLTREKSIRVVPGSWFQFAEHKNGTKEISIPHKQLIEYSLPTLIGIMAEEAGHSRFTRFPKFILEKNQRLSEIEAKEFKMLWNKIEDPRIWNLLSESHGNLKPYFEDAYDFEQYFYGEDEVKFRLYEISSENNTKIQDPSKLAYPLHLQFLNGFWYLWRFGSLKGFKTQDQSQVVDALYKVIPDFWEAIEVPRENIYLNELNEFEIQNAADKSAEIIFDKIWPVYKELRIQDAQILNSSIGSNPQQGSSNEQSTTSGEQNDQGQTASDSKVRETLAKLDSALLNNSEKASDHEASEQKSDATKDESQAQGNSQSGKTDQNQTGKDQTGSSNETMDAKGTPSDPAHNKNEQNETRSEDKFGRFLEQLEKQIPTQALLEYLKSSQSRQREQTQQQYERLKDQFIEYRSQIAPQINELKSRLKNILQMNAQNKYSTSTYDSGRKINIPAVMNAWAKYKVTGQFSREIFNRLEKPTKRDHDFVLVLDLSRSITDSESHEHVMKSYILFSEVLEFLGIPYSVLPFSDNSIVAKELKALSDLSGRRKVFGTLSQFGGGGTNDFDAIVQARKQLPAKAPGVDQFVIVMTDGEGRSDEVRSFLSSSGVQGINFVGIGIGEGMSFLTQVYPESILVENISQLPMELAKFIRKSVLKGL